MYAGDLTFVTPVRKKMQAFFKEFSLDRFLNAASFSSKSPMQSLTIF
jgi:hypothetical protein